MVDMMKESGEKVINVDIRREKQLESKRRYAMKNREKQLETLRRYYQENREYIRERNKLYMREQRKNKKNILSELKEQLQSKEQQIQTLMLMLEQPNV